MYSLRALELNASNVLRAARFSASAAAKSAGGFKTFVADFFAVAVLAVAVFARAVFAVTVFAVAVFARAVFAAAVFARAVLRATASGAADVRGAVIPASFNFIACLS